MLPVCRGAKFCLCDLANFPLSYFWGHMFWNYGTTVQIPVDCLQGITRTLVRDIISQRDCSLEFETRTNQSISGRCFELYGRKADVEGSYDYEEYHLLGYDAV
jgi:hypothetical protein